MEPTSVGDNIVVWTLGGDTIQTSYGANCVAVLGQDSVLLVDSLIAPAHARQIEAALRRLTNVPVRFVVLTHHHTDHTLGASVFEKQGAAVIAHRACRERMETEHPELIDARRQQPELRELFADAVLVSPAVTFDETLGIHVGATEVEIWHPGWGHTPGDAFLFLPEQRVAICGDLVFAGYHYNYEHASVPGVRQGLRALEALDADTFIPGHGPLGGPEILERQALYHETVERIVSDGVAGAQDDASIAEDIRTRFPDYRLQVVVPSAVSRFKEHIARPRQRGSAISR